MRKRPIRPIMQGQHDPIAGSMWTCFLIIALIVLLAFLAGVYLISTRQSIKRPLGVVETPVSYALKAGECYRITVHDTELSEDGMSGRPRVTITQCCINADGQESCHIVLQYYPENCSVR